MSTNIKELSEFEEYKNVLYKSAVADDSFDGLLPDSIHFDSGDEDIRHDIKLIENIILPFTRTFGYIISYRLSVSFGQKLYETDMLNELQSLTYEEFYDRINMLPKFLVRKLLGELNCTTSIFEDLLSLIYNQNKIEAVELMRNNNLDISLLSKKTMLLTKHQSYETDKLKFYNGEIKLEEYIQHMEEVVAFESIGIKEYETELVKLKDWFTELMEIGVKNASITNENEKETIYRELIRLILSFPDKITPFLRLYWDNEDMLTIFERKVLDEILMRDSDYYNEVRKKYDGNNNLEPLELPLGIFEEELNDIYNKIERFCPRGQNFTALFGYGKLSPIIWTGDWNALSYFLRVLYAGSLVNGIITFNQSVPTNMWENARKLFVDKKNNHPQLSSLKNRTISDLQKKDFAKEINYIFKNVFENIVTRKS